MFACAEPVRRQRLFWFDVVTRALGPDGCVVPSALESWTGRIDAVAYPCGAPRADYTDETVAIVAGLGFTAGFTTYNDFVRPAEPALERSRFVVLAGVTAAELAHRIAYAWPR